MARRTRAELDQLLDAAEKRARQTVSEWASRYRVEFGPLQDEMIDEAIKAYREAVETLLLGER